jgi:hypothetical protein
MITARDLLILRLALSVVCIAAAAAFLCVPALAQNNQGNSDNPANNNNQGGNVQGAPEANYVDPQTIPYIIMPRWPLLCRLPRLHHHFEQMVIVDQNGTGRLRSFGLDGGA